MSQNRATIFSNGIADFRRSYEVAKDSATEISIPVRKDHVADVLASLNIYGRVRLESPPTFRPANEYESPLSISSENVLEGLIQRLSGAAIEIEKGDSRVTGTLVGLQSEPQGTSGEPIEARFVVVQTAAGLQKVALRELEQLRFNDDAVQNEIERRCGIIFNKSSHTVRSLNWRWHPPTTATTTTRPRRLCSTRFRPRPGRFLTGCAGRPKTASSFKGSPLSTIIPTRIGTTS